MQKSVEGWPVDESRRAFLKRTFASFFVPRKLLEIWEITVPTLISHVRSNIQTSLMSWFLDNECDYYIDSLSLLLLKGAKIPLQVPNIADHTLEEKARTFLQGYDSTYSVFDNDSCLLNIEKTEESRNARKLWRFLASMTDDYEQGHGEIFQWTKKVIISKRKQILQALEVLPKKLWNKLKRHQFWIDDTSGSHLKDFQKQFLVEVLKNKKWTEEKPLTDEDYSAWLKEIEPLLQDIVEGSPWHYHDRYILEARLDKAARAYTSGKWWLDDLRNVPGFLQSISEIVWEEELVK